VTDVRVPFTPGFPLDWPVRPANYYQLDYFAHSRNFIHIWLPEGVNPGGTVKQALFILNEEVCYRFTKTAPDCWENSFTKPGSVALRGECRNLQDGLALSLELTNLSATDWPGTGAGVCVQLIAAPDFADTELTRTYSVTDGKLHRVGQPESREKLLHFYSAKIPPTDNFIAVESTQPGYVIAQWWDSPPVSIGGNCQGSIACIHAHPTFGPIPAGKSVRREGRLYLMPGTPQDAYDRYRKERG